MTKDKYFKDNFCIKSYDKIEIKNDIKENIWNPDLTLSDSNNHVIICEHSTTGDRKVHIGELIQFLKYVDDDSNAEREYSFLLFLEGAGESPPKKKSEAKRLKRYYDKFINAINKREQIKNITVIDYAEYKEKLKEKGFDNSFEKIVSNGEQIKLS